MPDQSGYDSGLTARLHDLAERVVGRTAASGGPGGSSPGSMANPPGTSADVTPPGIGGEADENALLQELLPEVTAWSEHLDAPTDPTQGFSLAQAALQRGQTLGERIRLYLSSSPIGHRFESALAGLESMLASLMRNALVRMEQFAKEMGVSSFSVTLSSSPPGVAVTFNFGGP